MLVWNAFELRHIQYTETSTYEGITNRVSVKNYWILSSMEAIQDVEPIIILDPEQEELGKQRFMQV